MYISVTQKVLKSCRSKMATLAHEGCDVHGASLLYVKKFFHIYIYIYIGLSLLGDGVSPPPTNQKFSHLPLPTKSQFNPIKKIKKLFLA